MQTKHLRGLLLILLLTGCGASDFTAENPYLHGDKAAGLVFPTDVASPEMLFGRIDLLAAPASAAPEPFVFQIHPHTKGRWIGGLSVETFDYRAARVSRTLSSLVIEDTTAGLRCVATALPGGAGIAFYLEGETFSPVRFTLAHALKDTLFRSGFKAGENATAYQLPDLTFFAVTAVPDFEDSFEALGTSFGIQRELKESKRRQVVVAFAPSADAARLAAETYRGMRRDKLERAARDSLANTAALRLHTQDDRTNRAFALLTAALAQSAGRVSQAGPAAIEAGAALARAQFLASRERSPIVFVGSAKDSAPRVRWGSVAYRAALDYGMADEDSLKNAALSALTEVALLSGSYATDMHVLSDGSSDDALTRLAVGHVRYAELLTLCGDISGTRGNHTAENGFRKEAARAARMARRLFRQTDDVYETVHMRASAGAAAEPAEDDGDDTYLTIPQIVAVHPPDTLRFMQAGAHYGFGWLSPELPKLAPATMDGFTWQKWTAHRFSTDLKVTQTPDLDSMVTLLLSGPVPGVLTVDPAHDGEASAVVMAAAYENLAELYLGVQPGWPRQRVDILPRLPKTWGRTAARVPVGPGFVELDFDFANGLANVGMSGIQRGLEVFFGYPLPSGGFARTQFTLSPKEPRVKIRLERDSGNRVRVNVKPAD